MSIEINVKGKTRLRELKTKSYPFSIQKKL